MKKILVLMMLCALQSGYCLQNFNSIMKVESGAAEKLNIPVDGPSGIAIHENTAYVCNFRSGVLTKIDLLTNQVEDEFTNQDMKAPYNIILDSTGSYAYIADLKYGLFVFDTESKEFYSLQIILDEIVTYPKYLTFGDENIIWVSVNSKVGGIKALVKISIETPTAPEIVDSFADALDGGPLRGMIYDSRNGKKNIVSIGDGVTIFNTETEAQDFVRWWNPPATGQGYSLCTVNDKLYITVFVPKSELICLNNNYEIEGRWPLGTLMNSMVFDSTRNSLFITNLGDSNCQKYGGGLGTQVYEWSIVTNTLTNTIKNFNSPQAISLYGNDLLVLDGSAPRFSSSCGTGGAIIKTALPFRQFQGGFAR